eukprot:TRINITY_DN52988_c0_g1_i1.p1 TRINITY_DN52988_c0_g1~~TRINITY_DN52988_c0_g1_i1.p1  ORF type:complete len:568 (+),score=105.06 TRINITY_DN52988_c0_g1_i1:34-1737(+)
MPRPPAMDGNGHRKLQPQLDNMCKDWEAVLERHRNELLERLEECFCRHQASQFVSGSHGEASAAARLDFSTASTSFSSALDRKNILMDDDDHKVDQNVALAAARAAGDKKTEELTASARSRTRFTTSRPDSFSIALAAEEKSRNWKEMKWASRTSEEQVLSIPVLVQKRLQKFINGWPFELFFAVLIVANAIFMGIQVDFTSTHRGDALEFVIIEYTFNTLFAVELLLRMLAEGRNFWFSSWWNYLDLFITATFLLEVSVDVVIASNSESFSGSSNFRVFRLMRITRFAKVIRIVRVVRFVRALRTLVYSIAITLKSLVWSLLLLLFFVFVFGILFTDAVSVHMATEEAVLNTDPAHLDVLNTRFNSLTKTMLTLFAAICGGVEWIKAVEALESVGVVWSLLFIFYMCFCLFALLNVVTGVFCQGAIESAERDQEMLVHAVLQDKQTYTEGLKNLFSRIDDDGSGFVTIKEFENHFNDTAVRNVFEALQLDPADAWELFAAIDLDGDGTIDASEFLEGCIHLRGTAKAINVAALRRDISKLRFFIDEIGALLQSVHEARGVRRESAK